MSTLALATSYEQKNEIIDEFDFNDALVNEYVKKLQCTDASRNTYKQSVYKFLNWLAKEKIDFVNEDVLFRYKNKYLIEEQNYKSATINTLIVGLKNFYNFLETKGIYNIAKNLKGQKASRGHKRGALTTEQIKSILNNIDTSTIDGKRDNAIFRLLITGALRECEIVRADVKDIKNESGARVLFVQGKGRDDKDEFVRLSPKTEQAISDYLSARENVSSDAPLFVSSSNRNKGERLTTRTIRGIVKNLYHNVGIFDDNITTHSTRHTAITLAFESGKDLVDIQALARHTNIQTTQIYLHSNNKIKANCEGAIEEMIEG